jgi:hypothetical protein
MSINDMQVDSNDVDAQSQLQSKISFLEDDLHRDTIKFEHLFLWSPSNKRIDPTDSQFQRLLEAMKSGVHPTSEHPLIVCLKCYQNHTGEWVSIQTVSTNSQGQVTLDSQHHAAAATYWEQPTTKWPSNWRALLATFGAVILWYADTSRTR